MEQKLYSVKTTATKVKLKVVREYTGLFGQKEVFNIYLLQGFFETAKYICQSETESGIGDAIRMNIRNVQRIDVINS